MSAQENLLYSGGSQPHLLVNALAHTPGRPVLHMDDGRVYSAGQVRDITSQYCQALADTGLARGVVVGILSGNRPEVLHASNACMLNEYVQVPLHPMGSLDDYLYVIEDAGIDVLLYDAAKYSARAAELRQRAPRLRHFLSFGPDPLAQDICALADGKTPRKLVAPDVRDDDLYRLSYSGGTTGKPKAIRGTHGYAGYNTMVQMAEWDWPAEVRMLICAPLSHMGGALFLPALLRGGSSIVLPGFDPVRVMETIEHHRITCTLFVPTMIYALLDHPRFGEFDLSSLESIYYGGSAMSPSRLKEGIEKLGPVFFQFYGQAEAPSSVTLLRRHEHDVNDPLRLASCGRPVPWLSVTVLDDDGREVPDGEPGEICVRGPLVMTGYHNKPEQTAEALKGGWLHTGDIAIRDDQGYLRIVDRKKDMIISGGFNVYPREVEDVIGTHPGVAACAVIGVPDPRWGEAVKAVIVARAGAVIDPAEIIALVREKKGVVQAPKSVDFVTAIPVTPIGKPDKKALRAHYAGAI